MSRTHTERPGIKGLRLMSELPSPPDLDTLVAFNRLNVEAITAATRVAMEGAQAVARRHMEILQQQASEITEAMKALSSPNSPQEKAAKQAEILSQAYQHAVSNLRELSELIQRTSADAMKPINARFTDESANKTSGSGAPEREAIDETAQRYLDASRKAVATANEVLESARNGNDEIAAFNKSIANKLAEMDVRQGSW